MVGVIRRVRVKAMAGGGDGITTGADGKARDFVAPEPRGAHRESARSRRCGLTRAILKRTCSNRAATPKQVMVSFTERSFDDP